jgi:hypothetical protein
MNDVDSVVQMLNRGEPPTIAELHRAAKALGRHAQPGQAAIKVRVAVLLEKLGA